MRVSRFSRLAATTGISALALSALMVAPASAEPVTPCLTVDGSTFTLTDDGSSPTLASSSLSKSAITVGTSPASVKVRVTTIDDCLGADSVTARLTSSTGAIKIVDLDYNFDLSDVNASDQAVDVWDANVTFANTNRGTWSLAQATIVPITGAVAFNITTGDLISDTTALGSPLTSSLPSVRKVVVSAATRSSVDGRPEPTLKGKLLTVNAVSTYASGKFYVGNRYVNITIQFKAPGSNTWKKLKTVKTNSSGRASASFKPSAKGTWSFRTVTAARTGFAQSISSTDKVTVK